MIAYRDEGKGPALVFLHGLGASKSCWEAQAENFKGAWRVIRPDLRGFGESEKSGPYSVQIFAGDMVRLLDSLQAWPAVIVGTSLGGYVALQIALQEGARVKKLALCHTACSRRVPSEVMAERLAALQSGEMLDYARVAAKTAVAPSATAAIRQCVVDMLGANDKATFTKIFSGTTLDFDLCAQLPFLSIPTLIISSEDDKVVPYARSLELHRGIADSRLEVIPGTSHLSYMEKPDAFNRALHEFLSDG